MTPAEHYREAEKLLGQVANNTKKMSVDAGVLVALVRLAQVHATLATAPVSTHVETSSSGEMSNDGKPGDTISRQTAMWTARNTPTGQRPDDLAPGVRSGAVRRRPRIL